MKRAIVSVLLASVVWLGAKAASAAVSLDCFSFQSNNKSIFVPAAGAGTVDVFVSGSGGAWVEILPANPTDHFIPIISDTAGHILNTGSGANGYARAYLSTGGGTVRVSTTGGVGFSAVAACKNTFPRNN